MVAVALGVVAIVVVAGFLVVEQPWKSGSQPSGTPGPAPSNFTLVPYVSSVDGFPLSYDEWLPTGFSNSSIYPLVVYLHGQQDTSGRWFPGGLSSDLVQMILNGTDIPDRATSDLLVNTTRADGVILIALNSRSGSGWYINSPCGGPQEQDVLDAVASEKSRHFISHVYLMGESMGTEGTLYVASQHPSLFSGIAVTAPVTDLFMDVAYRMTLLDTPGDSWAGISIQAQAHLFCGNLPGTANASQVVVARMFQNMSPLRFDPAAFAGVPIYMSAGGLDDRAPNNVSIWPQWMNANNTLVNATCNYAPQLGEPQPIDCATQTLDTLHREDPSLYTFRYVWEPDATHSITQLDPADLLAFWFGDSPGGYYLGAPSSTVVTVAPGLTY